MQQSTRRRPDETSECPKSGPQSQSLCAADEDLSNVWGPKANPSVDDMRGRCWVLLPVAVPFLIVPQPARPPQRLHADNNAELVSIKARESELQAQLADLQREKARVLATRRLRIGIVGFGRFGQFLAEAFTKNGHEFAVLSRSDRAALAADYGATSYASLGSDEDVQEFFHQNFDVVVLCVSIVSFEDTLRRLRPFVLNENHLFVDVLSVKEHAKRSMLETLPETTSILCTHPMFGPDSGRETWQSLPFVFDRVRIHDDAVDRCERFLSIFEAQGCKMVELSCRQHDVYAANSQFLTHLVGRTLGEAGLSLRKTPIDTKGFEAVLGIVETTCDDSFDLFYGLYRFNIHSKSTLLSLRKALADVELRLLELDLQAQPTTPSTSSVLHDGS